MRIRDRAKGWAARLALLFLASCAPLFPAPEGMPLVPEPPERLVASLAEGEDALAEALPEVPGRMFAFRLSPGGAEESPGPVPDLALYSLSHAVFFEPEGEGAAKRLYFCPRTSRWVETSSAVRSGADLAALPGGRLVLLRPLAIAGFAGFGRIHLALHRYEFEEGGGQLRAARSERLARGSNDAWFPVPSPDGRTSAWVETDPSGSFRIALDEGGTAKTLPSPGPSMPSELRWGEDGTLFAAAERDGEIRFCRFDPAAGAWTPAGPRPAGASASDGLIAVSRPAAQPPRMTLHRIPEAPTFAQLCALARGRNPEVARRRALVAANLAAAEEIALNGGTMMDLSFSYTPKVGVFLPKPQASSGDYLAQGVMRGVVGLVQPILGHRRIRALSEAELWNASIVRDLVRDAEDLSVTEIGKLVAESVYLSKRISIETEQWKLAEERFQFVERLRAGGAATRTESLGPRQVAEGLLSDRAFHEQRLGYLRSRILEVCGLPGNLPLRPDDPGARLERATLPSADEFRDLAAMNRSRLAAARGAVARTAAIARAGPDLAPSAEAGASYGQSRRASTGAAVDDYITTLLHARIPLASGEAARTHDRKIGAQMEVYRRELETEKAASRTGVEEALMDFQAAQRDWKAKQATWEWRLEALRETELRKRLLKEGGPVPDPLAVNVARFDVLEAAKHSRRVEMELFIRFGNLWRAAGLARFLPSRLSPHAGPAGARERPSVWLWETRKALATEAARTALLARMDAIRARRVYAYLGARGEVLEGEESSQAFRSLANACEAAGIEVFGLLGEPEWLDRDGTGPLEEAVRRAAAWSAAGGPGAARISGLKLDLEPHTRPGWAEPGTRAAIERRYAALLAAARKALPAGMPLWADAPPWYLSDRGEAFRKALLESADGLTLMCYRDREEAILEDALAGLAAWRRAAEVGIELSEKAPKADRMREWPRPRLEDFLLRLEREAKDLPGYAGPAFHDDAAVEAYFGAKQP